MPDEKEISDSPTGWVARHVRGYVESAGRKGHRWRGVETLLLTTRGRKTGKLRRTALIYGRSGDDYVVVASFGGRPHHPQWYLNLTAEPGVHVQVGADEFDGAARTAQGEERVRLWRHMAEIWPDYDRYQARTDRQIPVVVIEQRDLSPD
jgi:deazaflavin-dependent oxidoreductase (nitroreductase family)